MLVLIDKSEYKKSVESAVMFLKGETSSLFDKMEEEMAVHQKIKIMNSQQNSGIILLLLET